MSDTVGFVRDKRNKGMGSELAWTSALLSKHMAWSSVVGLPPVISYDLEYQVSPIRDNLGMARRKGFPRIDAVLRHEGGAISLLEAKMETAPQAIMGAVGQLLYYRTVLRRTEKVEAENLVIAAPDIPPLVGSMLEECNLPIRLLIVRSDEYDGLVPRFGAHASVN